MRTLELPSNDATQRLDQSFRLIFQSSPVDYSRLCMTFHALGGLPRTWLVKGDSGSGKTYLASLLCERYSVDHVITITIGDLAVMYPGDLLKGLKMCLASVKGHAKSVVILDNIELIFPREDGDFALTYAFQSWLLDLATQENESEMAPPASSFCPRVMILGLTQAARDLDPAVASLFDESIEQDIPTPEERSIILRSCMLNQGMSLHGNQRFDIFISSSTTDTGTATSGFTQGNTKELETISMKCHGYLPADLAVLCIQAATIAHRHGRSMDQLVADDFAEAMKTIKVSALRQSTSVKKIDPVHWTDIGGLQGVKRTLEESVIWLYKHAEAYARMSVRPSKGLLLYGPPGTGKTLLAKAVATESEANFLAVSIPDLVKGEVGESEKAVAKVFKMASRCSPCIVFLDELEAMFGTRESSGGLGKQLISQLLLEMDNVSDGVVILAATNHPEAIDASILRPGRLDRLVYVPPPTFDERVAILLLLKESTRISDNVDLRTVSNLTNNFTGADLKALVRKAGLIALKANKNSIEAQDFFAASSEIQPSISQFAMLRYEQFRRR